MEKWTGIISGTNRGLIALNFDVIEGNKIVGNFQLYDIEDINLAGKVEGDIKGNNIVAKVFDFTPKQDGIPTEGTVNLVISDDRKEMKGQWQTNIGTKGECVLYKFSITGRQPIYKEANLTLESKDIAITFCSFDKKSIEDLIKIMTHVANSIREERERILPPIYSITYDKEELVRTYSLDDFFDKFNEANKIWYVGFEFNDEIDSTEIRINLSHRTDLRYPLLRSNVRVQSTKKNIVTMIPEMVRGLVSKAKNRNRFWHHWGLEASIQVFVVITVFALSFFVSKKLALAFPSQLGDNRVYIFIILLIILSNLWTYFFRLVFNGIYGSFPVVEITNKAKNKLIPVFVVGMFISIFAYAVIYCARLLWKLLS